MPRCKLFPTAIKNTCNLARFKSPSALEQRSYISSSRWDYIKDFKETKWKEVKPFNISIYKELSKAKLSAFVLLTTAAGYALAPGAADLTTFLYTTLGTGLCIASANSINQWIEIPYDAQMSRTRNRALVRHATSPIHAFAFGSFTGFSGTVLLYLVNPTCAFLGFGNILLYTCIYTPLKRISIWNTWPGALVGAIPPLIGWIGCTNALDIGGILLSLALYSWQFPHFNALAWNLRPDYSKAGYRMMSVIDPALNARVALRHSIAMLPISFSFCYFEVASHWFLLNSSIVNGYLLIMAIRFFMNQSDKTARNLFFASLVHLPLFIALLLFHKVHEEDHA